MRKIIVTIGIILLSFILLSLPAGAVCSNNKKLQSYINKVWLQVNIINQANTKLQNYKSWYQGSGVDLTDYGFSTAEVNALNDFVGAIDTALTDNLINKLQAAYQASQGDCLN